MFFHRRIDSRYEPGNRSRNWLKLKMEFRQEFVVGVTPSLATIDLDPGPRANFARVVQIARRAKEVIDAFGLHAAIKTSGSSGLHIYLPLPPRTPNEAATLVAQMIATRVAQSHPKEATIERFIKARGGAMVYVDYLQNIQGKNVAGPYCMRAKPGATVSTPLEWSELTDDLDPRDFHLGNAPERFEKTGDIWNEAMRRRIRFGRSCR